MKLKYYGTGAGYGLPEVFCDCRICRHARENGNANDNTKFILSHIGHLVDRTHDELTAEAAEYGMIVAFDGMEIEF